MKPFILLTVLFAFAFISGCTPKADISKPLHFSGGEVVFDYPSNWKITRNKEIPSGRLVFIEDPGSTLTVLTIYGKAYEPDLEKYGSALMKTMGEKIPFNLMKKTASSSTESEIQYKYAIKLGSIDVPHTTTITLHRFGDIKVVLLVQVADEKRPLVSQGFDLIRRTLALNPAAPTLK